jgi:trehalose 6-phosphate phosphatase
VVLSAAVPDLLENLQRAVAAADHVFAALDFDGTLAPIVPRPEDAAIPRETADRLRALAGSRHCTVAVVSGRSAADLKKRIGLDVIYAGNHGLEIEGPGVSFVHSEAKLLRGTIDLASWDLEAAFEMVRGVFVERKALTSTVHYRQARAELTDWITATVLMITGAYGQCLTAVRARKAWEIRPRVTWDKGSAIRFLLKRLSCCPLLVCAGDDRTDEDMFSVSPEAISIKVGDSSPTRARYQVGTPRDLLPCLDVLRLAGARRPCIQAPKAPESDGTAHAALDHRFHLG